MRHVFTATTMSADQEVVKGLLDEAAIPCTIRNEHLAMALGELAPSADALVDEIFETNWPRLAERLDKNPGVPSDG